VKFQILARWHHHTTKKGDVLARWHHHTTKKGDIHTGKMASSYTKKGDILARWHHHTTKKGDLSGCNNWRGITLLAVPGKAMTKVLPERMKDAIEGSLRQDKAGFSTGCWCCEQIFVLGQVIEKVTSAFNAKLVINVIDFKKVFDCIHRPSVWNIMKCYGIPERIIGIIQNLYKGSRCAVRVDGQN